MTASSGPAMSPKAGSSGSSGQAHQITSNADEEHQSYSAQASTIVRTLALTAVGVIWLFAGAGLSQARSPEVTLRRLESAHSLAVALALALGALIADLLQYIWGSLSWSMYLWSLEQILINDGLDSDDLPLRSRIGWAVARAFHVAWHIEYYVYAESQAALGKSWRDRRANLRDIIRRSRSGRGPTAVGVALNTPWSPLLINRVISALFWMKIILLMSCYALLVRFLLL
jgi:hypothetical protein